MLYRPIRYINNGEPLDQVTLNRYMYDTQINLEVLFASVKGSAVTGEVKEIPNSFVKRDDRGTTQFSPPIIGTNPIRLDDVSVSPSPDSIVKRDSSGKAYQLGDGLVGIGSDTDPTRVKVSDRSGNLVQLGDDGVYVGIDPPPDVSVLYVSNLLGDDSNAGTRHSPLKTLHAALMRTPESSSTAIRLRAGETHPFGLHSFYSVSGATRIIEAYDDPYIDGSMVPTKTDTVWYYDWKYVEEVNRPILEFQWHYMDPIVGYTMTKLMCVGGGTWEFRGIELKRQYPPGSPYSRANFMFAGAPNQYNGTLQFYGCILTDLLDDDNPYTTLFLARGDTGNLAYIFQATKINIPTYKPLIRTNGAPMTLSVYGIFSPTPVPVAGITTFSDQLKPVINERIDGAIAVNGVYINLLTNIVP